MQRLPVGDAVPDAIDAPKLRMKSGSSKAL
jgi:hypothetical protein